MMRFPKSDAAGWKSKRARTYYGALFRSTPNWLSSDQRATYHNIIKESKRLRRAGRKVQVDHIVPLCHPLCLRAECALEPRHRK